MYILMFFKFDDSFDIGGLKIILSILGSIDLFKIILIES